MDYSASGIAAYVADLEIENRQLKKRAQRFTRKQCKRRQILWGSP